MSMKLKEFNILITSLITFFVISMKADLLFANTFSIQDLKKLITTNSCIGCNLQGIDLVNKDLSNAVIINSNLSNSN